MLCFTTSVLFSASNLGYFKLTRIPIKCETNGINTDKISSSIASNILTLNFMNNTMLPIIRTGVVRIRLEYILDINIVLVLIGNDFIIFIFFPSKLITELVIDVM